MIITKSELKILKYVYKKQTISFKKLCKKFAKMPNFTDTLEVLVLHHYLEQIGGSHNECGEPIPFTPSTMFTTDSLGKAEVEHTHWFDVEYVVSHIIIPIVLAIISTLITLFLSNAL